ncbi:MAG: RNA polymerase sigma factor [Terriglobales bacterium]
MEQPAELLQQFAYGDLDAFETLFRQFQGEVFRWTVRLVRDRGIAEDLTIETFWRIHRAHARFDPGRSFGGWARRIATNLALDYLKTARVETELPEDLPAAALPDPGIEQDVRERVRNAFGQLPPKLRIAATLALIEEERYQDIADALGISVGAVKLRVFRAVRLLRKRLKKLGVEP